MACLDSPFSFRCRAGRFHPQVRVHSLLPRRSAQKSCEEDLRRVGAIHIDVSFMIFCGVKCFVINCAMCRLVTFSFNGWGFRIKCLSPSRVYSMDRFRATQYPCPDTAAERREMAMGVATRIEDLSTVLSQTLDHRYRVLQAIAKNIRAWSIKVLIEHLFLFLIGFLSVSMIG